MTTKVTYLHNKKTHVFELDYLKKLVNLENKITGKNKKLRNAYWSGCCQAHSLPFPTRAWNPFQNRVRPRAQKLSTKSFQSIRKWEPYWLQRTFPSSRADLHAKHTETFWIGGYISRHVISIYFVFGSKENISGILQSYKFTILFPWYYQIIFRVT